MDFLVGGIILDGVDNKFGDEGEHVEDVCSESHSIIKNKRSSIIRMSIRKRRMHRLIISV